MSVFAVRDESFNIHDGVMSTARRGNGTTTWYAFEDPKTGREYFHEPVGGETSWVCPASSPGASNNATRIEEAVNSGRAAATDERSMDEKDVRNRRSKRMRGWGIAVVSALLFNTLFLLVFVKVLYENNHRSGSVHVHDNRIDRIPGEVGEKSVEADPFPSVEALEVMREDVVVAEDNPGSLTKAMGELPSLNYDKNKEASEEKDVTIDNRKEPSHGGVSGSEAPRPSHHLDSDAEPNCEDNPNFGDAASTRDDRSPSESKETTTDNEDRRRREAKETASEKPAKSATREEASSQERAESSAQEGAASEEKAESSAREGAASEEGAESLTREGAASEELAKPTPRGGVLLIKWRRAGNFFARFLGRLVHAWRRLISGR